MRKWVVWRRVLCAFCAVCGLFPNGLSGQLAQTLLERAQADVERTRALVEQGTLPQTSLDQAEERLADARDEQILAETLYGAARLQDMTPTQADAMIAAASHRVEREESTLEARQKLLDMGIISQAELASVKKELASRRLVADLARDRARLLDQLREMAATEQRMELPTIANSMIHYEGSATFKLSDLPVIEKDFKTHFHHDLPVSAIGQTPVHRSLGLDHKNKVDVALNPEQPEGLWLRHYLEKQHLSYLAFRSAVLGAATAPHIHIGSGSSRLGLSAH
jgi:hypothetical protein